MPDVPLITQDPALDYLSVLNLTYLPTRQPLVDGFLRLRPQFPIQVDIRVGLDLSACVSTDNLTLSYAVIAKHVLASGLSSALDIATSIRQEFASSALENPVKDISVVTRRLRSNTISASGVTGEAVRLLRSQHWDTSVFAFAKEIEVSAIIGINSHERVEKQPLLVTYQVGRATGGADFHVDHKSAMLLLKEVTETVRSSSFKTLEALAGSIAKTCLQSGDNHRECWVDVGKPIALAAIADCARVSIHRDQRWMRFQEPVKRNQRRRFNNAQTDAAGQSVVVGFGSNLGDRLATISKGLKMLLERAGVSTRTGFETSWLYESEPMYNTDQPKFLNGVIKMQTGLSPEELLTVTQSIESELGREDLDLRAKNGPRPLDFDILLYGDKEISSEKLTVPHKGVHERAFVLRPLCDLMRNYKHPALKRTFGELLSALPVTQVEAVTKLLCLRNRDTGLRRLPPTPHRPLLFMGILNVTPDSFSDGGLFNSVESAVKQATRLIQAGATIIDIGGQSSRPGADEVTVEEEVRRVVPVIRRLRDDPATKDCIISVDTYRSRVAQESIEAGADLINDISAGTRDPDMFEIVRANMVPIVCMHMRGDSKTMSSMTSYSDDTSLATEISQELEPSVLKSGLFRWNVIVDPGVGFAKDPVQSMRVLKSAGASFLPDYPILIGASRKSFMTKGLGVRDSDAGTLGATCASLIWTPMDRWLILRVHNVQAAADAVRVFDAVKNITSE